MLVLKGINTMKKIRIIVIVVAIVLSISLSFVIFFNRSDSINIYASNSVSNEFLIQGVKSDFQFKVILENERDTIEVYDNSGELVDSRVSKKGNITTVKSPQQGYQEGERYRVTLPDGARFEQVELKEARSIIFVIKKKEVAIEILQVDVKDIRDTKVVIQSENEAIIPFENEVEIGDVLIVEDDNTGQNRVLKVIDLSVGNEGQVIQYETPEEDDVYEELDIYKTYKLTAKNIIIYEDAIISWVEEEGIIDKLFSRVSAASEGDIKIELKQKNDRVIVSVKIFPSKEDFRVGVELELEIIMNATMQVDGVLKSNMFINTTLITSFRFIVENKPEIFPPGLISVDKANDYLNSLDSPLTLTTPKGKIFGIAFPITSTINAFVDFDIPVSYEMTGGASMVFKRQLDMGVGVVCDQKCEVYTSVANEKSPIPIELVGKLGFKSGVSVSFGVEFFWSVKTGVEFERGVYAGIEGLLKSSDITKEPMKVEGYFEFEMGSYYEASAFVYRDGLLFDFDFQVKWDETKDPFVTISNSNILQNVNIAPITIKEGKFQIGDIEAIYYNVISRKVESVPINIDYMSITFDGSKVRKEDGYYLLNDMKIGQNNVVLDWVHNGQKFRHNSIIELKDRLGKETLISELDADEVVHIQGDYWSYRKDNKYGIVTSQGKIVEAIYDDHFAVYPTGQICSYRNNNFVGFDNDIDNQINCDGFGWSSDGYYYDESKKWMYEHGYNDDIGGFGLVKADFWYVSNQRIEIVRKIVVGEGSTEDYVRYYSDFDEYSLVKISKTGTNYRYTSLTNFDYVSIFEIIYEQKTHYIAKAKNGKWGLIDNNGTVLINPSYEKFVIQRGFNPPEPSMFTVFNNGKYYVIDKNEKVLIESAGDETFTSVHNDKFWINRNNKWYMIDIKN